MVGSIVVVVGGTAYVDVVGESSRIVTLMKPNSCPRKDEATAGVTRVGALGPVVGTVGTVDEVSAVDEGSTVGGDSAVEGGSTVVPGADVDVVVGGCLGSAGEVAGSGGCEPNLIQN